MHAAGGLDAFLEEHAVIVMADHSQTPVERALEPGRRVRRRARAAAARPRRPSEAEIAVCPAERSAHGLRARRRAPRRAGAGAAASCAGIEGVDLVHRGATTARRVVARARRAALRARRRPRATCAGARWSVERRPRGARRSTVATAAWSRTYPDALGRLWSALKCPHVRRRARLGRRPATSSSTGAAPTTSGGGSHGSLHRGDSLGVLLFCGIDAAGARGSSGRIRDVTPHGRSTTSLYRSP